MSSRASFNSSITSSTRFIAPGSEEGSSSRGGMLGAGVGGKAFSGSGFASMGASASGSSRASRASVSGAAEVSPAGASGSTSGIASPIRSEMGALVSSVSDGVVCACSCKAAGRVGSASTPVSSWCSAGCSISAAATSGACGAASGLCSCRPRGERPPRLPCRCRRLGLEGRCPDCSDPAIGLLSVIYLDLTCLSREQKQWQNQHKIACGRRYRVKPPIDDCLQSATSLSWISRAVW